MRAAPSDHPDREALAHHSLQQRSLLNGGHNSLSLTMEIDPEVICKVVEGSRTSASGSSPGRHGPTRRETDLSSEHTTHGDS